MSRFRIVVAAAVALGLVLPAVRGDALAAADPLLQLRNEVLESKTTSGHPSSRMLTYRGRSTLAVPSGTEVAPDFVVGNTATLDPATVPGIGSKAPYIMRLRTTALASSDHRTNIAVRQGFSHVGWFSGVVAAGSRVHDGEYAESMVSNVLPAPTTPARDVTSGGALRWEPVEPVTHTLSARDWDPSTEDFSGATVATASASAVLGVEGGGLIATEDVAAPPITVPLPGFTSGIVFTARQSKLPDVAYESRQELVDDGAGGRALRIHITVPAGTRWPESGDEGPAGTWKLRIDINAVDLSGLDPGGQGGAVVEVASAGPGDLTTYMLGDREPVPLPDAVRTALSVDPSGVRVLDALPWPPQGPPGRSHVPMVESSRGSSPPAGCHASTDVADYQAAGALAVCVSGEGVVEMTANGVAVGSFGLPYMEVNGMPIAVEWIGGDRPRVHEHTYWNRPDSYGSQFWVTLHGRAGALDFDALMIVSVAAGGASVLPLVLDYRNHTDVHGAGRLGWLVDADAGSGEQVLAYGGAPLVAEAAFASDGLTGLFGVQPSHVVEAPGETPRHTISSWAPLDLVVFRRDTAQPMPSVPEAAIAPPESLAGGDVAAFAVTYIAMDHSHWYANQSAIASTAVGTIPQPARGAIGTAIALGVVAAGQTGLTWYVDIQLPPAS